MRHRIGYNRLGRNVSHRQALYRSMATALFKYERIRTTKPKAKEIRRVAEKMISRARTDSVHNRRIVGKRIKDKAILAKLFTDIGPRFTNRPGGYTRILKLGQRYGDGSEMVLLELVERMELAPRRRKKEPAKSEAKTPEDEAVPTAEGEDSGSEAAKIARRSRQAKASGTGEKTGSKPAGKSTGDGTKTRASASGAGAVKKSGPAAAAKGSGGEAAPAEAPPPEPEPAAAPEVEPPSGPSEET